MNSGRTGEAGGHALMQAIARVNRVFGDKPGGLIVDYLGVGTELKAALADYSARDREEVRLEVDEAVRQTLGSSNARKRCSMTRPGASFFPRPRRDA
jgi:type I restriction enzyme R subunit